MKSSFVMFFIIVFTVYAVGSLYLFVRGWQSLEIIGRHRVWFAVVFWIAALSYIVSQALLMGGVSGSVLNIFFIIGSCWIAIMLYGFLMSFAIDIFRIIGWAGKIKPNFIYDNYMLAKAFIFGAFCIIVSIIFGVGFSKALHPRITHLEISIDKQAGHLNKLRAVMISDLHLGHIHGDKFLTRVVDIINQQNPDIVFLAGDIYDGAIAPVIDNDLGANFNKLKTKYGVYFAIGNHEYLGARQMTDGLEKAVEYLISRGVQPLLDTVELIDGSFYVAGRKDKTDIERKSIPEILNDADNSLPLIILDHQPFNLHEAEQAEIDLQLSGHTHHGQMFPLNYLISRMYEKDWGFLQKNKTHYYISCGVGTWGPPIRTAGFSEIVVIDIEFSD